MKPERYEELLNNKTANYKKCNMDLDLANAVNTEVRKLSARGECLTSAVVYKDTITAGDSEVKTYTGPTERKF